MTKDDLFKAIKKTMEENPRITDVVISEEHISYNYHPPYPLEYIRLETKIPPAIHPAVATLINWKETPEWFGTHPDEYTANCPVCSSFLIFKYRNNDPRNELWRLRCQGPDCGTLLTIEKLHGQLDTVCMDLPIQDCHMTVEIDYKEKTIEAADWYGAEGEAQKLGKHVKFPMSYMVDYGNLPSLIKIIKEHLK